MQHFMSVNYLSQALLNPMVTMGYVTGKEAYLWAGKWWVHIDSPVTGSWDIILDCKPTKRQMRKLRKKYK